MRTLRYGIYLSVVTLALLALSSCICENNFVDDKGVIVMSLSGVQTRGGDLFVDDAIVAKVRVIVFVNNYIEKNQVFSSGEEAFQNPFRLEVVTGTKMVYAIANETAALGTLLGNVKTTSELDTLLADVITGQLTPPLVMAGKTSNVNVALNTVNNTTVTLTRVAAKISLSFLKDTDAEVKITRVSLLKNTGKTSLYEGEATIGDQTYWDYAIDYSLAPFPLTSSATTPLTVYVYENLAGSENKTNATQLEVEALFNGVPTKYRVYVNEAVSAAVNPGDPSSSTVSGTDGNYTAHPYQIKRNHHHNLTGTIKSIGEFDGLTLTTEILPWNKLSSSVLFERVYEINPYPTYGEKNYTVNSPSDEVSFTFTLKNPVDASWKANLTNPADFEFVGGEVPSGTTWQTIAFKIKPKNTQDNVIRTTELIINVNYGGNWEEIPLISGQNLVGEGNRIVIRQPSATNP